MGRLPLELAQGSSCVALTLHLVRSSTPFGVTYCLVDVSTLVLVWRSMALAMGVFYSGTATWSMAMTRVLLFPVVQPLCRASTGFRCMELKTRALDDALIKFNAIAGWVSIPSRPFGYDQV